MEKREALVKKKTKNKAVGEGAGQSNVAETRPVSKKAGGFTMRERQRLRQAPAPGRRRGLTARPGARRAWEDGKGARESVSPWPGTKAKEHRAAVKPPSGEELAGDTHSVEQVERAQAVLGTREAPANHLGACGSQQVRVNLAPAEPPGEPLCPCL